MTKIQAWVRAQSKFTLITLSVITVLNVGLLCLSAYYCTIFAGTVRSLRSAHSAADECDATIASTSKEITQNPLVRDNYQRRARLYMREEKYDKALEDLSKVVELDPKNIDAYIDRAFLYDQLKNAEAAKLDRERVKALYAAHAAAK